MDQSTTTSDEVITVSSYINFELIVHHLIEAAKKHEPVAMDKEIIDQCKFNIESGKYSNEFEAFLCAFDEWMQK
tara:strand:- start:2018 stop:2239 length:222 start_codon:yes stop_codon:yes gene_type:complete